MRLYVDPLNGSDLTGDGTSAKPWKSLTRGFTGLQSGDELIVNDAANAVISEPTIVVRDLLNVDVKFLKNTGSDHTSVTWKPSNVDSHKATLYLENCSNFKLEGAVFGCCTANGSEHLYAVRAVNCQQIYISNCHISSPWSTQTTGAVELFSFNNAEATVTSCSINGLINAFDNDMYFISASGSSDYNFYSNSVQNVIVDNGKFAAIWIKPDTRKVVIDGLLVHNVQSQLMDYSIGMIVESDNSQIDFIANGCKFSTLHIGVVFNNIPTGVLNRRLKHSTFYKCHKGISANDSLIEVYSCNFHSQPYRFKHEYPPGHINYYSTNSVFAENSAYVKMLNCVMTGAEYAMYATTNAVIECERVIWNNCENLKKYDNNGDVLATQFVRRVDPLYENLSSEPYGEFTVSDQSPCIDAGKFYGDPFIGLGPDIGALERSKAIKIDDIPALAARTARFTDKVPLTNIDMIGMVSRGLETQDPSVQSAREGSAVKDIAVKPLTVLMAPYTTELEYIRNQLAFSNIESLSEESADMLASNVFVTRNYGGVASGIVRLYFSEPTSVLIPAEIEFTSAAGYRYYTVQAIEVTSEEMSLNFENGMYYMDTVIEASGVGAEYNADANTITSSTAYLPTSVVAITNPYSMTGGSAKETNAELKEKVENAITVRDLVTKKGINFVTMDSFPFLAEVRPIGFRDSEMLRDVIFGYHIGGKVDIYVKTRAPIQETKIYTSLEAENTIDLASFGNVPVLKIDKIELLDPITLDSIDITLPSNKYSLRVENPNTRFSLNETVTLLVDADYVGLAAKVTYTWIPEIRSLQEWVEDSDDRVVCADLLVKHFQPAIIDFTFSYYASSEIAGIDKLLASYVDNLKSQIPLQASDLVEFMYTYGATKVMEPFTMRMTLYDVYGKKTITESEDELITNRTSRFMSGNISAIYLGVDPNG